MKYPSDTAWPFIGDKEINIVLLIKFMTIDKPDLTPYQSYAMQTKCHIPHTCIPRSPHRNLPRLTVILIITIPVHLILLIIQRHPHKVLNPFVVMWSELSLWGSYFSNFLWF
jgi:hypothetical protein